MLEKNKNGIIAIDESLFCHTYNNEQIWLVGLINTYTKYFRIEAVKDRNAETLKKIIYHHVETGNTLVTDGCNSGFRRIIHNHCLHDFGF